MPDTYSITRFEEKTVLISTMKREMDNACPYQVFYCGVSLSILVFYGLSLCISVLLITKMYGDLN